MSKVACYPFNGTIAILHSTNPDNINIIAQKDIPNGVPFNIVDITDLPEDKIYAAAWEMDFSSPSGYGTRVIE